MTSQMLIKAYPKSHVLSVTRFLMDTGRGWSSASQVVMGQNRCSIKDAGDNWLLCPTVQREGSEFISWGCHDNWPQNEWLKKTEIYFLTVLGAINPKSRCRQAHVPSGGSREESFPASSSFWWFSNPWHSSACTCIFPNSASVITWPSSLCISGPLQISLSL